MPRGSHAIPSCNPTLWSAEEDSVEEIVFSVSLTGEIWLMLSESITGRHLYILIQELRACPASDTVPFKSLECFKQNLKYLSGF